MKIKILPENIANKIAAGEVVERPASVVKELVENSIDAGASRITVEIKGGGVGMIKVSDDGCGMSREDAVLSLERHATSKIKDVEDIYSIRSLGFRGEALPSIASVSRFELCTSEGGAAHGTAIKVDGGKNIEIKDAGMSRGTVVTVSDLFYNVPARRKFLKSAQTETSHILNLATLSALSRTDIAFKLIDNGKEVISVEKGMDLKTRISMLFGSDFADALLPLDWKSLEIRIGGFISKPEYTFSNKSKEYFFVNNRAVQNRTLLYAVSEGYRTLMPHDRSPFCLLFISIDPSKVDVNIHPAKREVRFVNEPLARDAVVSAIKDALERFYDMPKFSAEKVVRQGFPTETRAAEGVEDAVKRFYESQGSQKNFVSYKKSASEGAEKTFIPSTDDLIPQTVSKEKPFVIGQTNRLYIVAEARDGIIIIDQHAAHERVLYEKTMKEIGERKIDSQKLLLPVTLELPKSQSVLISQYLDTLEKAGIGISLFGDNTFMVDAVPSFVENSDVKRLLKDIVEELEAEAKATRSAAAFEEKLIKTLCRLAVKAKDKLSQKEQTALVEDLFKCKVSSSCPHGRPTMIKLTNDYLAKEFKRT